MSAEEKTILPHQINIFANSGSFHSLRLSQFVVVTNRQVFTVQKLITATTSQIRSYRRSLKQALLERAKAIGTTALFGSSLIPDWKRLMPDDTDTLRKILEYAEKRAVVPQDHADLANWRKKYLNEEKDMTLFTPKN